MNKIIKYIKIKEQMAQAKSQFPYSSEMVTNNRKNP